MRSRPHTASALQRCALAVLASLLGASAITVAQPKPFLPVLVNSSTIPATGDVNPYGVAFVPSGFPSGGYINAGEVLISNFNNSTNIQGTGTTIVMFRPSGDLAPPGSATTFFYSPLPGLSTALGVLRGGFVLVGNVPTTDGTFATIGQGALQVIDRFGQVVQTWTDPTLLDGPWDLTIVDEGSFAHIFVANVLNGTVSRFDVVVGAKHLVPYGKAQVAKGYTHVPNAAAVVLGPTGLAYDSSDDTLYVASTADNTVYAVTQATTRKGPVNRGTVAFSDGHLRGPLALRFVPNGNLVAANGDAVNADPEHPSELVEFTKSGSFVREYNVDASQGGAFGFDSVLEPNVGFNLAVVDDVTNSVAVYRLP